MRRGQHDSAADDAGEADRDAIEVADFCGECDKRIDHTLRRSNFRRRHANSIGEELPLAIEVGTFQARATDVDRQCKRACHSVPLRPYFDIHWIASLPSVARHYVDAGCYATSLPC